ncbi:MAG: GC-type dockerin domain-anchored protein, partial [Phycisphaerales bacterium JB041]
VDSGLVRNDGDTEAVIFSHTIFIPGAAALRLEFDEAMLSGFVSDGSGSYLRIRSLFDGGEQRLDARHVEQWQNTSAYFNGDEVTIEIVAKPGTGANRLAMSVVQAEFEPFVDRSICGPTDDRVLSSDNRAARLLPVGCTGWLINDCNSCFLTAGHCSTSNSSINVVQFNVPLSNSEGSLNHPAPEDQYAFDVASRQSNNGGGVGNDYAYFGVFPNSNTGLTPAEAYGDVYQLTTPPPVQGQDIRITGYGTTGNGVPRQWNQVQKTHTGPYFSFNGTTLSYQTDTTGGNSGSPVINEDTGEAIGIHTHGGCGNNSGNYGTGANHTGLQTFLSNPKGVCECPQPDFFFPGGRPESIDPAGGTEVVIEVLPNGDADPEPGTGVFYVDDGSGFIAIPMDELQDNVYVATFPAVECRATARYYFSAETADGETAFEPREAPGSSYEVYSALSREVVLDDNFDDDFGWTVINENVSAGGWKRSIVQGNPNDDYNGGGKAYITGNGLGNPDLDGGPTRLLSPTFDLSGLGDPYLGYARWFSAVDSTDRLTVELSDDGGATWATVEDLTDQGNQWVFVSHRVADYVSLTGDVVVRFSAVDGGSDSRVEGGIDAFILDEVDCGGCVADFNGDGSVNTQDVLSFLNAWNAGEGSADINGDGTVNTQDVLAFLNLWNTGC